MSTIYDWSTTAASNNTADASVNWREGQAPSTVNNSTRAMMAAIAKFRNDQSGTVLVSGGSSTAYTVTTNSVLTLADGISVCLQLHATNGAAPTFNPDGVGAKAIRVSTGLAVASGIMLGGSVQRFTYDLTDDCWYVNGAAAITSAPGAFSVTGDFAVNTSKFTVAAASGNTVVAGSLTISGTGSALVLSGLGNNGVELGRVDGSASTPFWDFHSGATAVDYDSRIIASGGSGASGGGSLDLIAASLTTNGVLTAGIRSTQQFTASGTWTKPAGCKRILVFGTGGGGGGGDATSSNHGVGGGGAGGTSIKFIDVSAISSETVTIGGGGAGGTGGGNGATGGNTTFGAHFTASGGAGGTGDSSPPDGGTGGTAATGNINIPGGDGNVGIFLTGGISGNGGASFWGGGARGTGTSGNGVNANAYGAGGSGGFSTGSAAGGAGAGGIVWVIEFGA